MGETDAQRGRRNEAALRIPLAQGMNLVLFTSLDPGRAPMGAAFFNALVEPSVACAIAAAPEPARLTESVVTEAMSEFRPGIILLSPCRLTAELGAAAAHVINVGTLPERLKLKGLTQVDWEIADPWGQPFETVRSIRDEIRHRVSEFLEARRWAKALHAWRQ
jgi:arsenate reductase